ncbi:MAG TPA: hypothetical protein VH877_15865 [Polyangia bacterium]|nr:hypothetical protein [Polyangia bacterium]
MSKRFGVVGVFVMVAWVLQALPAQAQQAQQFPAGSLIIPMDIDYQDASMLRAFGLLYQLLRADIPVNWCIQPGKTLYVGTTPNPNAPNAVDFVASAQDIRTNATITAHGYRGGPFVIDAGDASRALQVIAAWNTATPLVGVHRATADFTATVSRRLVSAPNIGINGDGNEAIAFGYLNAAGIPDSRGNAWSSASPDLLTPAQVAGPTTTSHQDGRLFGASGLPVYCQLMSMHWTVQRTATNEEAIAEMRNFLTYPTHLFAECQAVNMLEDSANGHFVTTNNRTAAPASSLKCSSTPNGNGLCAAPQPTTVQFFNSSLPFAQLDGPFRTVGGSEPSYGWATGSQYYDEGIVMMRNSTASAYGVDDLWMTGYATTTGTICYINDEVPRAECAAEGKVSYLGGHQYTTKTPLTTNPTSQGTRLFLNSLFEADCATASGQPALTLTKDGPANTTSALVTYTLSWSNQGPGIAIGAQLVDVLPPGASFVSASNGGTVSGSTVTWNLGEIGSQSFGQVTLTVTLGSYGSYVNAATLNYTVGVNRRALVSNQVSTSYGAAMDMGAPADMATNPCTGKICPGPSPANPCRQATCDPQTGACGIADLADGSPCDDGNACTAGTVCRSGACQGGVSVQCPTSSSPCQQNVCDPTTGCTARTLSNGTTCSNGDACVIGETCQGGVCTGGASRSCPSSTSACEVSTCHSDTGCGFTSGNDGAPCDDGDACTAGTTCLGGLCVGGQEQSCPPATTPCTVSLCTLGGCTTGAAAAGTDPRGDCPPLGACSRSCDGSGTCTPCAGPGEPCTSDSMCTTGLCTGNVCSTSGGNTDMAAGTDLGAGGGADLGAGGDLGAGVGDGPGPSDLGAPRDAGDLGAVDLAGSTTDGAQGSGANGRPCQQGNECLSGVCVDGVCCDRACNGTCEACNNPDQVGSCRPLPAGTDPAGECGAGQVCNGAGACVAGDGSSGGKPPGGCSCTLGGAEPHGGVPLHMALLLTVAFGLRIVRRRRGMRD